MKFIRKHTKGPWKAQRDPSHFDTMTDIVDADGYYVAETVFSGIKDEFNTLLIAQAPTMLDYLIERAEKLNYWIENKQLIRNGSREELSSIIEIFKAAGVEVL